MRRIFWLLKRLVCASLWHDWDIEHYYWPLVGFAMLGSDRPAWIKATCKRCGLHVDDGPPPHLQKDD